jgi:two-component system capsular synthesis response regulator RcsB
MMTSATWSERHPLTAPAVCRIGRILIMDACPINRTSICSLNSFPQFQVGEYLHAEKVRDIPLIMQRNKIDVVISELCGEGESVLDGLRTVGYLCQHWPQIPIIIATTLQDTHLLTQLLALGVNNIYLKQDTLPTLSKGIFNALSGIPDLSPLAATLLENHPLFPPLTRREMDVLEHLFTGQNVTSTARALNRDIRTISTHKRNAMNKLGFHNDCDLYTSGNYLSRNGLLV